MTKVGKKFYSKTGETIIINFFLLHAKYMLNCCEKCTHITVLYLQTKNEFKNK